VTASFVHFLSRCLLLACCLLLLPASAATQHCSLLLLCCYAACCLLLAAAAAATTAADGSDVDTNRYRWVQASASSSSVWLAAAALFPCRQHHHKLVAHPIPGCATHGDHAATSRPLCPAISSAAFLPSDVERARLHFLRIRHLLSFTRGTFARA
jgi:hypothetical protein